MSDFSELSLCPMPTQESQHSFGIMEMMWAPPSQRAGKAAQLLPAPIAWKAREETETEDSENRIVTRLLACCHSPVLKDHDDMLVLAARPRRGAAGGSQTRKMQSSYPA
mmetsp:Transcript_67317/g.160611  ORF Transcript_67317/g.160611 Transcript_67317/m.160611 type:complete len:109 (-) Transcript_67317:161-487(-)